VTVRSWTRCRNRPRFERHGLALDVPGSRSPHSPRIVTKGGGNAYRCCTAGRLCDRILDQLRFRRHHHSARSNRRRKPLDRRPYPAARSEGHCEDQPEQQHRAEYPARRSIQLAGQGVSYHVHFGGGGRRPDRQGFGVGLRAARTGRSSRVARTGRSSRTTGTGGSRGTARTGGTARASGASGPCRRAGTGGASRAGRPGRRARPGGTVGCDGRLGSCGARTGRTNGVTGPRG
jgi:hypothetical protein